MGTRNRTKTNKTQHIKQKKMRSTRPYNNPRVNVLTKMR